MLLNTGTRMQTRQAFSVVNGGQDLPPINGPLSNSASDCGVIEFTKEDVDALLNEKLRIKNKFNYKVCWSGDFAFNYSVASQFLMG